MLWFLDPDFSIAIRNSMVKMEKSEMPMFFCMFIIFIHFGSHFIWLIILIYGIQSSEKLLIFYQFQDRVDKLSIPTAFPWLKALELLV